MKFKVTRTSIWNDEISPCKEANRINERGYIQREFPNDSIGWFIEINSLEELMNFKNRYGDIVITNCWENQNITEIEIYDTYRE